MLGLHGFGQLGVGSTANAPTPVNVASLASGVQAIAAGAATSFGATSTARWPSG